ncbi:G-protein coupled receptor GRL101-like [Amphiura filiformis]|uniref:G-protein coupled receptor GRL101-like n=1 Tax=Amphiura filiformis TaxID=82378 RepID=UPI003B21D46E
MWAVPIQHIMKDAFSGLIRLKSLVIVTQLSDNDHIDVKSGGLDGIQSLQTLYVDDHRLCCHFQNLDDCITVEPQPPLFMCGSLMQNYILRVSMWVLGISAVVGNAYVVIWRFTEKTKSSNMAKQSFLIGNLAISDSLMGIYMLILACADLYYGDDYFVFSDQWRSGPICKLASFICLMSSEASVFLITLISVDRFLCLVFPFSPLHLRLKSTRIIVSILWVITLTISVIPTVLAGPNSDFYDLSDVCVGLPLITRPASFKIQTTDVDNPLSDRSFNLPVPEESKPAWYFSIALFLGVNLICFAIILVCYIAIFINVQLAKKKASRTTAVDEDLKMALRMAAIVGTDFICWVPIIIMGILSQTGMVVIPLQMYTWSVVFILPVNSSINPYMYTVSYLISDFRSKKSAEGTVSTGGATKSSIVS